MKNNVLLSSALLIGGIILSGCAPKQAWSPELEAARHAYQRAATNPQVTSLAAAELDQAQRQLKVAEDAADYFKGKEVIAHEATLARLKAAEAEQAARGLQAKENLRLAQAGAPVPQALPTQSLPFQRGGISINEPLVAAATPHAGSVSGGSASEIQQIALQLAALSGQISRLQTQMAIGAQPATTYAQPVVSQAQTEIQTFAEPALGAARPTPDTSSAIYTESGNNIQPSSFANAPVVVSDAHLREELRALNARPAENGMALTLGERYFDSGSARLWRGRASRHLDNVASVMAENPDLVIDIEAHTDNQGSEEQKDSLTSDRAIAVKSALVLRGVDGSRINTTGFGDSKPKADNSTQLGRLQNRRVEIVFPNIGGF